MMLTLMTIRPWQVKEINALNVNCPPTPVGLYTSGSRHVMFNSNFKVS